MNDRNRKLFFDEDSDYSVSVTITDENGQEEEAEILGAIEVEELNREFVAVLPQSQADNDEMEALILEYSEDENGDPVFSPVEEDDILELAANAFNQFFAEAAEDEEEDEDDSGYLDDIGDILPGVSIQKD